MPTRFGWGPHGGRPYAEDTLGTPLGSLPLNQSPPPLIHVWHRQRPFPQSLHQMTDNCPGLGGLVAMETASSRKILNRAGDLLFLWMLAALGTCCYLSTWTFITGKDIRTYLFIISLFRK